MWNIGSLRESIRENARAARERALAAAEVAHGVLTAAAEEDETTQNEHSAGTTTAIAPPSHNQLNPSSSWNSSQSASLFQASHNVDDDTSLPPPLSDDSVLPPPPPSDDSVLPPPPPSDDSVLPPPPAPPNDDSMLPPPPPSGLAPPTKSSSRSRSRSRPSSSRYVVAGVNTTPVPSVADTITTTTAPPPVPASASAATATIVSAPTPPMPTPSSFIPTPQALPHVSSSPPQPEEATPFVPNTSSSEDQTETIQSTDDTSKQQQSSTTTEASCAFETTDDDNKITQLPTDIVGSATADADQNDINIANAFGFDVETNQDPLPQNKDDEAFEPQPWPTPSTILENAPEDLNNATEVENESQIPPPASTTTHQESITTSEDKLPLNEIKEPELHVQSSSIGDEQSTAIEDPPERATEEPISKGSEPGTDDNISWTKPSASGKLSDDVNWFSEHTVQQEPDAGADSSFQTGFGEQFAPEQTQDQTDVNDNVDDGWGAFDNSGADGVASADEGLNDGWGDFDNDINPPQDEFTVGGEVSTQEDTKKEISDGSRDLGQSKSDEVKEDVDVVETSVTSGLDGENTATGTPDHDLGQSKSDEVKEDVDVVETSVPSGLDGENTATGTPDSKEPVREVDAVVEENTTEEIFVANSAQENNQVQDVSEAFFPTSTTVEATTSTTNGGDNYETEPAWSATRVPHAELEAVIAELTSKKEELQSKSHELEIQHEDLQSTRRELEVKASELQSKTEELDARQNELNFKKDEIRTLCDDRNSAMAQATEHENESNRLRVTIEEIRHQLTTRDEQLSSLSAKIDTLTHERNAAMEEKLMVEHERDVAVERGGDGLREARNVIEELRNNRATAEVRELAITQEVDQLRSQLDQISGERNELISEIDGLRNSFNDAENESVSKAKELGKRIKIAETETEIAQYERQKVIESNNELKDTIRKLQDAEQERVATLSRSESRIRELEMQLQSGDRFREEEAMRIEAFTELVEEMKERTQNIIEERNVLYNDKLGVEGERDTLQTQLDELNRKLLDAEREVKSMVGERDEWKHTCDSLREQVRDANRRYESTVAERDRLMQERTMEASVSDREKTLAKECEQKAKAVAILQKKLSSASSKVEKLMTQRSTFQRQRDDAGMRLRAAGSEFMSLNKKLEELTKVRDDLERQMVALRDDRDVALTKVQELSELKPKLDVLNESIEAKEKDIKQARQMLQEEQGKYEKLLEESSAVQQKCTTLTEELKDSHSRTDIVQREKELLLTRIDNFEVEIAKLNDDLKQARQERTSLESKLKENDAQHLTERENASRDLTFIKSELAAEQKARGIVEEKLSNAERESIAKQTMEDEVRCALVAFSTHVQQQQGSSIKLLVETGRMTNPTEISDLLNCEEKNDAKLTVHAVTKLCSITKVAFDEFERCNANLQSIQEKLNGTVSQLQQTEYEIEELRRLVDDSSRVDAAEMKSLNRRLQLTECEKTEQMNLVVRLQDELANAQRIQNDLSHQLSVTKEQMKQEMDINARKWASESAMSADTAEKAVSKLQSIWTMLERAIGSEQARDIWDDANDNEESDADKISMAAFRGTASMVAEIGRKRNETLDLSQKLKDSDAEVVRLIDRAEMAESERDALRSTADRMDRKAKKAHVEGIEEARTQFEAVIHKLEDELNETRDEMSRVADKAKRSEKEANDLRGLVNKLTAQLNSRTNELDETEEKLAYVQDQVSTLQEDLEEAHRRMKVEEEESEHTRLHEVERLQKEVEQRRGEIEHIEKECVDLRQRCDEAEKKAKECQLLAETHKQAEENLEIAIAQLEAAQQSAVEERTIELERKVSEAEEKYKQAKAIEEAAMASQNKLQLRDDEIKELRGAIGRLSDERVELKLELEKNLSRLNHPDAGGQLVDRRVVRQLLVSYFRVGSVRRRDVLELMSRMLAFSDADNLAVGLKRRALMDRIGKLVQAPEVEDDASLPPIGTVSDKWIEFLMKETEEGEEQEGQW